MPATLRPPPGPPRSGSRRPHEAAQTTVFGARSDPPLTPGIRRFSPQHLEAQTLLAAVLLRSGRTTDALAAVQRLPDIAVRQALEAMAEHDAGNAARSQAALDRLVAAHASNYAYNDRASLRVAR